MENGDTDRNELGRKKPLKGERRGQRRNLLPRQPGFSSKRPVKLIIKQSICSYLKGNKVVTTARVSWENQIAPKERHLPSGIPGPREEGERVDQGRHSLGG